MTPPHKKGGQANLPYPQLTQIPDKIGKCIARDTLLVRDLGWGRFFRERRGWGAFAYLGGVYHPSCRLLRQY